MDLILLGLADSAKEAPEGVERWGMPWHPELWVTLDRFFEIHDMELGDSWFTDDYIEKLKSIDAPLYMNKAYFDNATAYPLDEVVSATGDYFESTISYMLALAIYEGYKDIGIYGVSMNAGEEYAHQRPNLEYLIGLARGKGISVTIPHGPVNKYSHHCDIYPRRYGWQ